jgi:hypothetical protein
MSEQVPKDDRQLPPREMSTEAEVRARAPKPDVRVGLALDVEDLGSIEHSRIPIRRAVEEHHTIVLFEVVAGHRQALGQSAPHEHYGRRNPHNLFDGRGRHRLDVVLPDPALLGVLTQQMHA